jgi:hypothetical protein
VTSNPGERGYFVGIITHTLYHLYFIRIGASVTS